MSTPLIPPQEVYIVTLANGYKIPIDLAAFEEVLKADRKDTGELVAISPFDYISTRYIVSAFKKVIMPQTEKPAETSTSPTENSTSQTDVPSEPSTSESPVENSTT